MSLADLANRPTGAPPNTCGAAWAATRLDADDAAALQAAFRNPAVTASEIADELEALRLHVSAQTVGRHRRGRCSCGERLLP